MILIDKTEVMNLNGAIRGARNPLASWHKSDSYWEENEFSTFDFILGENDLGLANRLATAGSDHGKFLRQIFVCFDITAPLYFYKEFDTYKISTVANSTSTMHTIHKNVFNKSLFSMEDLIDEDILILQPVFDHLEKLRNQFNDTKDKSIWRRIIQMNFDSFNQTRTVTMNYENLRNIYFARKNHKLTEWHTFCEWIESLPYAKELITSERNKPKEDPNYIRISKEEYSRLKQQINDLEKYKINNEIKRRD